MKGKLIIIEGGDGSGKATQTQLLKRRLQQEGYAVQAVSFPDYDSPSSTLVKMYLHGDFGKKPEEINPYAASTFYAIDRFASYQMKWRDFLAQGMTILADRYTTSNMLYQMIKIDSIEERKVYLKWLWDFEFNKLDLPIPDEVILLDVPLDITEKLMLERIGKTGGETGDIHEKNKLFLKQCHDAYDMLAKLYGWQRIQCAVDGVLRNRLDIHEEIFYKVVSMINANV